MLIPGIVGGIGLPLLATAALHADAILDRMFM
jgi:hypothetical protein